MNYSIEKLADLIQNSFEFESSVEDKLDISDCIDFDDVCVDFSGYAKGYLNSNAESILTEIYIESAAICSLTTGFEIYELSNDELIKLEQLITW